jgi:hypothetical protein
VTLDGPKAKPMLAHGCVVRLMISCGSLLYPAGLSGLLGRFHPGAVGPLVGLFLTGAIGTRKNPILVYSHMTAGFI